MIINNNTLLSFFFYYLLLTALSHAVNIEVMKYPVFLMTSIGIAILAIYVFNNFRFIPKKFTYLFIFYTIILFLSLIINYDHSDPSFTIKYFGIFIFLLTGYLTNLNIINFEIKFKQRFMIRAMLVIPLAVYIFDTLILNKQDSGALFVNRNNAVLFGIASSYLILVYLKSTKLFYTNIYANIIIYKTLGALLASIFGLLMMYFTKLSMRKMLSLSITSSIFFGIGFYLYIYSDIAIFERLRNAVKGLEILFSLGSIQAMANASYADIAYKLGNADLSFLFRIKHWFYIMNLYLDSDALSMLLGHGNDSLIHVSKAHLRAHNDYIRLLFEVGLIFLLIFLLLNFYLIKSIGINKYTLPFIIVLLYFFTENLIDNFLAMSMLYFMLGAIIARKKSGSLEI